MENQVEDSSTQEASSVLREEPKYADFTRFEIELEFVQCLSNPFYLHEISNRNYFDQDEFLNYIKYLEYFKEPKYARYLSWPGPTLRALELLQQKPFRDRLGDVNFIMHITEEWMKATSEGRPK